MNIFLKLLSLYNLKYKLRLFRVILFVSFSSFAQFFFLTSLVLVISVLADSSTIFTNKYLFNIYNTLNFDNKSNFIFFLISVSFCFIILSALFNLFNNYLIFKYSNYLTIKLEQIFFSFYINTDYHFFNKNSQTRLISKLKDNISLLGIRFFPNIFVFFSAISTLSAIILILFFIDYLVTLIIFFSLLLSYYFFFFFLKNKINFLSSFNNKLFYKKTKFIIDVFKNIKVLKFFSKNDFDKIYYANSKLLTKSSIKLSVLETSPRVFMEFLLYAGSLLLIFYFYKIDSQYLNISKIVFFGLASSKALPSFNQIFASIVNIKSSFSYINVFSEEINIILNKKNHLIANNNKDLIFDKIKLNNVSFSFDRNENFKISELNIEINKNSFVAICGKSGSGKTTIVDLLSGIYKPNNGFLSLDNLTINDFNIYNYRNLISYVPQEFHVTDGTIREAITFGQEEEYFNNSTAINFALKFSGALNFVNNLPNKVDTEISDRGIMLSLGQKQRISIARALYKKPKILILDESTNSLDLITEKNILNDLKNLCNFMTVILISHRISSLAICDYLYLIKDGKVFDKGTFNNLSNS